MDNITKQEVLKYFYNIPEKEMRMYEAVIKMIEEGHDMNGIKVSDITGRAGIGKGTAYEYFSSKEEIIVKALMYDTYVHLQEIRILLQKEKSYKGKFYLLMDYLEENLSQAKGVGNLLKIFAGTYEIQKGIHLEMERICQSVPCPVHFVEEMIDDFMKQGFLDGEYTQENVILRRSVFASQITGYIYCIFNQYYNGGMTKEVARDFTYNSVIKLLNS